jgi:hypothetical protein
LARLNAIPLLVLMRPSFGLQDPHPQGGPIPGADGPQAHDSEPQGPYCLLPAGGAPPATHSRPASARSSAPTLAWSRSHGDP